MTYNINCQYIYLNDIVCNSSAFLVLKHYMDIGRVELLSYKNFPIQKKDTRVLTY